MFQLARRQTSPIDGPGAGSDEITGLPDQNSILDGGCTRRVGGIKSAAALYLLLGIEFELRNLDCDPF